MANRRAMMLCRGTWALLMAAWLIGAAAATSGESEGAEADVAAGCPLDEAADGECEGEEALLQVSLLQTALRPPTKRSEDATALAGGSTNVHQKEPPAAAEVAPGSGAVAGESQTLGTPTADSLEEVAANDMGEDSDAGEAAFFQTNLEVASRDDPAARSASPALGHAAAWVGSEGLLAAAPLAMRVQLGTLGLLGALPAAPAGAAASALAGAAGAAVGVEPVLSELQEPAKPGLGAGRHAGHVSFAGAVLGDGASSRNIHASESAIILAYVSFYVMSIIGIFYSMSKLSPGKAPKDRQERGKYTEVDIEEEEYRRGRLNWLAVGWMSGLVAQWGHSFNAALTKIKAQHLPQLGHRSWQTHESGKRFEEMWRAEVAKVGEENASLSGILPELWGKKAMAWSMFVQAVRLFVCQLYTVFLIEQSLNYFNWLQGYVTATGEIPNLAPSMVIAIFSFSSLPFLNVTAFSTGSALNNRFDQQLLGGIAYTLFRKGQRLPSASKHGAQPRLARMESCTASPEAHTPDASPVAPSADDGEAQASSEKRDLITLINYDVTMQLPGCFEAMSCCINSFIAFCILLTMLWSRLRMATFVVLICAWPTMFFSIVRSMGISEVVLEYQDRVDKRVTALKEVLFGIRVVKCYAWEEAMEERITKLRSREIESLAKFYRALGVLLGVFMSFPRLLVWSGLWGYSIIYGRQDIVTIFTCMVILGSLRACCELFAASLGRVGTWAPTIKRVEAYLKQPEAPLVIPERVPEWVELSHVGSKAALQVQGTFSWTPDDMPTVKDLDVSIPHGELVAVLGEVGAGKSTFLHALLGELHPAALDSTPGSEASTRSPPGTRLQRPERLAYCQQVCHIAEGTVKENVIFGQALDEERYALAVHAASLESDIELLTGGHQSLIGARGISLSGGQKARVALARAAYNMTSDTVLLDDPFSALDAPTAQFVLEHLLLGDLLRERTRIVVMQPDKERLTRFDRVLVLDEGRIVENGPPNEIMETKAYKRLISSQTHQFEASDTPNPRSLTKKKNKDTKDSASQLHSMASREDEQEGRPSWMMLKQYIRLGRWRNLINFFLLFTLQVYLYLLSDLSLVAWTNTIALNPYCSDMPFMLGYLFWVGAATLTWIIGWNFGTWFTLRISAEIHSLALYRILRAPIDVFFDKHPVGRIMNRLHSDVSLVDLSLFLRFFGSFATVSQSLIPMLYVHSIMPWYLTLAALPLYWLIGGIVARAWNTLVPMLYCVFSSKSIVAAHVGDIASSNVVVRAFGDNDRLALEFSEAFNDSTKASLTASRVLKRWLVNRISFLWSFYTTSTFLVGMLSVRTLGAGTLGLCMTNLLILETLLEPNIENSTGALFEFIALARIHEYLGVPQERAMRKLGDQRYQSFVVKVERAVLRALSLVPGPTPVVYLHGRPLLEATPCGRALAPVAGAGGGVGALAGLAELCAGHARERLLIAEGWHRIVAVGETMRSAEAMAVELCRHGDDEEVSVEVRTGWLADGAKVEIQDLRAGYAGLPRDVLKGITLTFEPKMKVAIAGTTGCGKSSLLLVLLRVLEPRAGKVRLNGVDTQDVGVATLRDAIGLVPQDPVLFSGTLRYNLDPFDTYTDAAIYEALKMVHLSDLVESFSLGLGHVIADEGGNLSFGQRQLVCLARMVLRRPSLLLLDEATSAIDPSTQELVQNTLDEAFASATVLAVAHRLETVLKFDYAVVLDHGSVAEQGPVAELKECRGGWLRSMLEAKGAW